MAASSRNATTIKRVYNYSGGQNKSKVWDMLESLK